MADKTIGTSGDYTTIALWSAYVKGIGTLTANETGILIDSKAYVRGSASDLAFSGVTLSGFTILLKADDGTVSADVRHDGDFSTGARVEVDASFGGAYEAVDVDLEDFSVRNTQTTNGGARVFINSKRGTYKRVIAKSDSTGANSDAFENSIGTGNEIVFESCRGVSNTMAFDLGAAASSVNHCTAQGAGFNAVTANTANNSNNVVYGITGTEYGGTWSGTNSYNAGEDAGIPGTNSVTLTANPYDVDGYTPASSGQLDGAGVASSITLDAANNTFNTPPSIGAYEVVGGGGGATIPVMINHYKTQGIM